MQVIKKLVINKWITAIDIVKVTEELLFIANISSKEGKTDVFKKKRRIKKKTDRTKGKKKLIKKKKKTKIKKIKQTKKLLIIANISSKADKTDVFKKKRRIKKKPDRTRG